MYNNFSDGITIITRFRSAAGAEIFLHPLNLKQAKFLRFVGPKTFFQDSPGFHRRVSCGEPLYSRICQKKVTFSRIPGGWQPWQCMWKILLEFRLTINGHHFSKNIHFFKQLIKLSFCLKIYKQNVFNFPLLLKPYRDLAVSIAVRRYTC